jgi:hypothetical protein
MNTVRSLLHLPKRRSKPQATLTPAEDAEQVDDRHPPPAATKGQLELILPGDVSKVSTCPGAHNDWESVAYEELEDRARRGCPVCIFKHDILQKCLAVDLLQPEKNCRGLAHMALWVNLCRTFNHSLFRSPARGFG